MKKIIKSSMKEMLMRYLTNFSHEKEMDSVQIESYANNFVNEFERYLNAYNDFKEEN